MKKIAKRVLLITMCCILLIPCLAGCAQKGKTFMELDGEKMSVNTYMLFLSRVKGTLASSANFGASALRDSFWDTVMSSDGVTTYNDHYTQMVLDSAKTYLAASYLFEKEGLKLDDATKKEIESAMDTLVSSDGEGSKTALNSKLAEFGANYAVLKDAYEIEAKIAALNEHLYGENGSKISANVIEEYYQNTYVKFKHVFLYTYAIIYETDDNGDEIYYTSDGRIAYDTERNQKTDANGDPVKDKNGDIIYVKRDGSIAYDTESGERKAALDDKGYAMTREYTTDELRELSDMAQIIMESAVEGDEKIFDSLVEKYNEDAGMDEYSGGYYLTKDTAYDSPEVLEALFEMSEGEIRQVRSDYGIHIVMKYKLDEGGYAKSGNAAFFVDSDGNYLFMNDLQTQLLDARLSSYVAQIEIKEELIEGVDMKSVGANYNY